MDRDPGTVLVSSVDVERKDIRGLRSIVLALLAAVIVLDQATKWWAWRHASTACINYGGNPLVGATVGGWYADPVTGALLDLLDFGLLSIAVSVLVRRRLPAMVLIPGALMIGGWSSNLFDRLGMHNWTAPGSVRGAVDFIHLGQVYWNVADIFIIGGTSLFLPAASCYLGRWATKGPATTPSVIPTTLHRRPMRTRMSAFVGAVGLICLVGIGAVNYNGVTTPITSASASGNH
jgi:lipoprotein signal peptidase